MSKSQTITIEAVKLVNPQSRNLIFGQAHFIKTVEDLHEALVTSVPGIKYGLAFAEASGPRLVRTEGTDPDLIKLAADNILAVGCGHTFIIILDNAFPINVLRDIKAVAEVVTLFCATANPVEVIVARSGLGGAVLGVVDGSPPQGIEKTTDIAGRKELLRKFGYKR